jgi:hypothetical protein
VASGRSGVRLCRVSGAREIPGEPRLSGAASVRLAGSSGSLELLAPKPMLRCSDRRDGSGSLAFPAPSSTFRRCRPGPRGVPFRRPLRVPGPPRKASSSRVGADGPRDLGPLFEALSRASVPPRGRASSREIRAPLRRHLPRSSATGEQAPVGSTLPGAERVPPSWFLTTSTASSKRGPRVCCAPQPARGSSRFGAGRSRSRPKTVADLRSPSPRRSSYPSKSFPRRQPVPRHRGPLPSCRYRRDPTARPGRNRCAVGPGEPGAAGSPRRPAGVCRRPARDEAPIRRSGPPRHPGRARTTGEPVAQRARGRVRDGAEAQTRRGGGAPSGRHGPQGGEGQATRPAPKRRWMPSGGRSRGHPPRARITEVSRADPSRRREQPTSRRCSVDESVVSRRRCRRDDTRSFHGLGSPPRSARAPHQPRRMPCGGKRTRPKPSGSRCRAGCEAGASTAGIPPTIAPRAPAGAGDQGRTGGRSRIRAPRLFSEASGARDRAPRPRCGRSRPGVRCSVAGVCPEARS